MKYLYLFWDPELSFHGDFIWSLKENPYSEISLSFKKIAVKAISGNLRGINVRLIF